MYAELGGETYEEYDDQYDENTVATTEDDGGANELGDDEAYNIIVKIKLLFPSEFLFIVCTLQFPDQKTTTFQPILTKKNTSVPEPLPHLCYTTDNRRVCEAYTETSRPIDLNIALKESIHNDDSLEANAGKVCKYPVGR